MRKILNIGGNDVAFENNAATPVFYKAEFKHDYFSDLMKLSKAFKDVKSISDLSKTSYEDLDHVDMSVFTQMAWACAKSADMNNTKPYLEWLLANPEFSPFEHGLELVDVLMTSVKTKKK